MTLKARRSQNELLAHAAEQAKQGDYEAALEQLKQLVEADERHEIAHGMLGGIYAEIDMPERAIAHYEKALSINPKNPLARLHLGLMQMKARRFEDVLATWRPNLKQKNDFLAHFFSGMALLALARKDEAQRLLRTAAAHMPSDHPLRAGLDQALSETYLK